MAGLDITIADKSSEVPLFRLSKKEKYICLGIFFIQTDFKKSISSLGNRSLDGGFWTSRSPIYYPASTVTLKRVFLNCFFYTLMLKV